MRNTVWNLRFISYSKERKRQEKTQFGSSYLAGWNSFLHFFLPMLQPPLLLLSIFRWIAGMVKFKLHKCASHLSLTKIVLVQYHPTHPSHIKAKSSGCLTQRRLLCKYSWNSAQKGVSAAQLVLEAAALHGDVQHYLALNPQLMCQHKAPRPLLWKRYRLWGERSRSAPAGREAALSTSCTQKGELDFGSHRHPPWIRAENKALWCNNLEVSSAAEVWGEWLKQEEDMTDPNQQQSHNCALRTRHEIA